jgi:hypothetical protein
VIRVIPDYRDVPPPDVIYLPDGPMPEKKLAPSTTQQPSSTRKKSSVAQTTVAAIPTALRAWNGQESHALRAFDQTRAILVPGTDGSASWQFYWKTDVADAQSARWEITSIPFVAGATSWPPAGLIAYGDASIRAALPMIENFFTIDFSALSKDPAASAMSEYYLRVVPVDGNGEAIGAPSNFVRIERP